MTATSALDQSGEQSLGPVAGRPSRAQRWRLLVVVAVVLGAVTVLALAGINRTLVYYRTPTELVNDQSLIGKQVRVGGLVLNGSLHRTGGVVTFTLTDGATDLPVRFTGPIKGVFAPGRDALVQGRLTPDGTFLGEDLMVKHDNNYRAPDGKPYSPPASGGSDK